MTSISSLDINNNFHELRSFKSRHFELSDPISRLDVKMIVDAVILNYNFKVTSIIQIDNTSSNVSNFMAKLERSATLDKDCKAKLKLCQ